MIQLSDMDVMNTSSEIISAIGWLSAFAEKEGPESRHYHYINLLKRANVRLVYGEQRVREDKLYDFRRSPTSKNRNGENT